jgi:hypothetical protein
MVLLEKFRDEIKEVITKLASLKIEDIKLEDCSETSESSDSSCDRRRRIGRRMRGFKKFMGKGRGRRGRGRHGRGHFNKHNKDSSTDTDSSCEFKRGRHGRKRMMWMKKFKGKFSKEEWKEKK